MKTFAERIKYLSNDDWKQKKLLPLSDRYLLKQQIPDTEIIYDFEAQENIYSISALYVQLHKLIIWYHTNSPGIVDEEKVLQKAYEINALTIAKYEKQLQGKVEIEVRALTFSNLQLIFEHPKRYVVGFNSSHYDLPLASYILAYGYNHDGQLPLPAKVRTFSNLLIHPQQTINNNYDVFGRALKPLGIKLSQQMSLWQLAKFYDNVPYHQRQTCVFQGEAPMLNEVYRRLMNTGLHLDMRKLNESKDTSLKRIAAQFGYQIEEPESVDLSSNDDLKPEQMVNLLAYNASDVLVTMLIYQDSSYQDPEMTREDLLATFDADLFHGRLTINSTSAQFVELIIAPDKPLEDQTEIDLFYPVHGKKYQPYQDKISQDYDKHFVPEDFRQHDHFVFWLESNHPDLFRKIAAEYRERISILQSGYPQYNVHNSPDYVQYQAGLRDTNSQMKPKLNALVDQIEHNYQIVNQYCKFLANDQAKSNMPLPAQLGQWPVAPDRDSLDLKWTLALQHLDQFKPVLGPDNKMHQYSRVKYGEIQVDLLELMRLSFKKFPKEVYELYSYFRNAQSIYEYDHGKIKRDYQGRKVILKTARQVGLEKFVNHYLLLLGKGKDGKAIPPRNVFYEYHKDKSVASVKVIVQVPGQPMVLSYSVGGVHGEVMNDKAFLRDQTITDRYNANLKAIQEQYPDPMDFYQDAIENHQLKGNLAEHLNVDKFNKTNIKLFITKTSKTAKYKAFKKQTNPKDYVIPIDMHNAVHVDVDSLYPSLMINLHMFSTWQADYNDPDKFIDTNKTGHWYDIYAKLRLQRIQKKKFALATPKEKWTYVQEHAWSIQLKNKLVLNSASGIADGGRPTNVRMNNKAASMRIMGQLALTYLVFRVEPKGVYSTSTNTDGVYLTSKDPNFTEKEIDQEISEWKTTFNLGATPEIMSHFVSKDSNNRFEQGSPEERGDAAGGTVGNFTGPSSTKKMALPYIVDAGIINYFKTHDNVCKTYDIPMDDLIAFLKEKQNIILNATEYTPEVREAMLSFCWPIQPVKQQNFCLANKENEPTEFLRMQHINRLLLTKHGYYIKGFSLVTPVKSTIIDQNLTNWCLKQGMLDNSTKVAKAIKVKNYEPDWHVVRVNLDLSAYYQNPVWADLDLDNYASLTRDKILGSDSTIIWVEPKFKPLSIAKQVEELTY